jgi:hypothetical protein
MSILNHTATIEKFTTMYVESYEAEQDFVSVKMATTGFAKGVAFVFRLTKRTADIVSQLEAQNGTGNWGDVSAVKVTFNPGRLTPEVTFKMNETWVLLEFVLQK